MDISSSAHPNRRRVLKTLFGSLTLIPLVQLTGCSGGDSESAAPSSPPPAAPRPAAKATPAAEAEPAAEPASEPAADAQEMPRLSEDDPAARALGYRHDAADVDTEAFPRYNPGNTCGNCSLFMATDGSSWAGCPIFRGRLVSAEGWCTSWVARS